MEPICVAIEFPVATYYAAKKREGSRSDREIRDEELIPLIRQVWEVKGKGVYGGGRCGNSCVVMVWRWRGVRWSG